MVQAPEAPAGAAALEHAYQVRLDLARAAHANGAHVIGLVGNTIPVELVLACGRAPVLVAAELGHPTQHADIYMEDVIPPETKSLFDSAARGDLEFLDLLVLSRPYAHLYYYLKECTAWVEVRCFRHCRCSTLCSRSARRCAPTTGAASKRSSPAWSA